MLRIFYADIRDLPLDYDLSCFSAYRQKMLQAIQNPKRRQQEIGTELLLIHALPASLERPRLPLTIAVDELGKPYLQNSRIQFSTSHSGPYTACAVAAYPLGLDIQTPVSYNAAAVKRCCTENEEAFVQDSEDKDYAFTMLWSMKESVMKAKGTGFHRAMKSFSLERLSEAESPRCEGMSIFHCYQDSCHFSLCRPLQWAEEPIAIEKIKLL